ncbi:fanconi-associated nuclease 1 isoform X2 [Mixophyes fleayi]|uniref:fanconi-associated nuclease 1 isoform X2 n=1 Tax=Mixophyes fleayi TaxID=3061075 RepID=UPI003F4E3ACB
MSQMKTPEKKKSRLSLSKNKSTLIAKVSPTPKKYSSSPSILALFKNAPPAKLSCPLCGEMVPRFGLNDHIDETCPKAKQENHDVLLVSDHNSVQPTSTSPSPQLPQKPKTTITRADSKTHQCDEIEVNKKKASPYFEKNAPVTETPKNVRIVTTVPLGSLSSKLSRRYRTRKATQDASKDVCLIDSTDCNKSSTNDICNVANTLHNEPLPRKSKAKSRGIHIKGSSQCTGKVTLSSKCDSVGEALEINNKQKCSERVDDGVDLPPNNVEFVFSEQPDCKSDRRIENSKRKVDECLVVKTNLCKKAKHSNTPESCFDHTASDQKCDNRTVMSSIENNSNQLPMEDITVLDEFLKPFNDTDSQTDADNCNTKEIASELDRQPYYLRNFLMVLKTVMESEEDMSLFNEEDTNTLTAFSQLSAGGQKLYVRLFQRKMKWMKINKIEYSEIGSNLIPFIEELNHNRFLQTDCELQDLSEALDLLSAPELKALAKGFHLANPNAQKQQLLEDFLRLSKQRSIFSMGKNQSSIAATILKKAKDVAGQAVRVCKAPRAVFSRALLLFSLTESMEVEEAASGGQNLLSTVLMVNMGHITFPPYTVQRTTKIFQGREDLIRYESAMHKLIDIVVTVTNGKWKEAHLMYQNARKDWDQLKNEPTLRYHAELPLYLRCFTVGWVYTRILSRGVEILQRLHLYEAILFIMDGLSDPYVRTGHQLSLYQRAVRMRDSPSCKKFRNMFSELPEINVEDVPHVTIKGKMCPQTGMGKSVFLMENLDEEVGEDFSLSTIMCSVEELALAHYIELGFDQGIHGEGSTFCTLYGLFMWDIVFMEGITDVFRNSYQSFPLDLYTDSFYENRKDAIESRLKLLQDSSTETLHELMADVWNVHQGEAAALVSWERFSSLQQAQSLVSCLGGSLVSGICRKMSIQIRHCKGGLPDLVVWNAQKSTCKLVEVKGPNDRLSHKQMVWLHELKKMGADAEVCHVVSIGAKSNRLN